MGYLMLSLYVVYIYIFLNYKYNNINSIIILFKYYEHIFYINYNNSLLFKLKIILGNISNY